MDTLFLLETGVVLLAIFLGAKLAGIGLGMAGGFGLFILTFVFGLKHAAPPIDVMLIITAVVSAAATLQAAGGLDVLVNWSEKLLRVIRIESQFWHPLQLTSVRYFAERVM